MARTYGQIQHALASGHFSQSTIQSSLITNSAMSCVYTTEMVSFNGGERSILGAGEIASTGRLDARTAVFGPGGSEHIIPHFEAQESSSMLRGTRSMAQDELTAVEQHSRRATFIKVKDFIDPSKNISEEQEMQQLKRDLMHGPDAKQYCAWNYGLCRSATNRPCGCGNKEFFQTWKRSSSSAEASKSPNADRAKSNRLGRICPKIIYSASTVNKERTVGTWMRSVEIEILFAKNQIHLRDVCERSEISARLFVTEVQTLHHRLNAARENSD